MVQTKRDYLSGSKIRRGRFSNGLRRDLNSSGINPFGAAWKFRMPILSTNNNKLLTQFQIPIALNSGNFNFNHETTGTGIRITGPDGRTVIPAFYRPRWNNGASEAFLVGKFPTVPTGTNVVIGYLQYGNSAGSDLSNGPNTFVPPAGFTITDVFQHGNFPRPYLNTGSPLESKGNLAFLFIDGDDNAETNGALYTGYSSDSAQTWTSGLIATPAANNAIVSYESGFVDNNDGAMYAVISNGPNSSIPFGTNRLVYVIKSTDGGVTWSNYANQNPIPAPNPTVGNPFPVGKLLLQSNGDIWMLVIGARPNETLWSVYVLVCPAGNSLTDGNSWSLKGGSFTTATVAAAGTQKWGETDWVQVGSSIYVTMFDFSQHSPGDLYFTKSTDGGSTWSAPALWAYPGAPTVKGQSSALNILTSGAWVLSWTNRNQNGPAIMFSLSSDQGTTWRSPLQVNFTQPVSDGGYQQCLQIQNGVNAGKFLAIYYQNPANDATQNRDLFTILTDEDTIVNNSTYAYFTNFNAGTFTDFNVHVNVTADSTVHADESANAAKVTATNGSTLLARDNWPTSLVTDSWSQVATMFLIQINGLTSGNKAVSSFYDSGGNFDGPAIFGNTAGTVNDQFYSRSAYTNYSGGGTINIGTKYLVTSMTDGTNLTDQMVVNNSVQGIGALTGAPLTQTGKRFSFEFAGTGTDNYDLLFVATTQHPQGAFPTISLGTEQAYN